MKKAYILVAAALASLAYQTEALTIETPIANVYSLGTLTTDTGDPNRFTEGTFTFTAPIVGFHYYKLTANFDPDGVAAMPDFDIQTTTQTFINVAPQSVFPGNTLYHPSGGLGLPGDLVALHFYILSGGGANAAFVDFPTAFTFTLVQFLPDPIPSAVPDGGSTAALLGVGALGLVGVRRRLAA